MEKLPRIPAGYLLKNRKRTGEGSALPHRNFKSVAKENTFLKSCIIRGSLSGKITCSKIVLSKSICRSNRKTKNGLNKSEESKNIKTRWENWSNRCLSRWRGNVGTRYLETRWWWSSSKSSYPHRWRPARRGTRGWTARRVAYAERSNRGLALPVQRVERTSFHRAYVEHTDADPSSRQRRSPWKGTTDNTRRALLLPLQPALNWI